MKLPSNLISGHIRYIFFADKAGPVEFAGYQRPWKADGVIVKGHPDYMIKIGPYSPDGKSVHDKTAIRVPVPGTNNTAFTVNVPKRGLYQMLSRIWGSAFTLTESSVPVALEIIGRPSGFKSADGAPITLFVPIGDHADSCILISGLGGAHGAIASLIDPLGKTAAVSDTARYWNVFPVDKATPQGLHSLTFRAQDKWPWKFNVRLDSTGSPLFFFLSAEKIFTCDARKSIRATAFTKVEVGEQ